MIWNIWIEFGCQVPGLKKQLMPIHKIAKLIWVCGVVILPDRPGLKLVEFVKCE